MNISLTNKELFTIVSSFLFMSLLSGGIYFALYYPKMSDAKLMEQQVENEERLISALESSSSAKTVSVQDGSTALQRNIPVKPLTEQIILQLERAEIVSGVVIKNTSFADEAYTPVLTGSETTTEEDIENLSGGSTEESATTETAIALPASLKRITTTLEIESPSYYELENFIKEIEKLERIHVVSSLTFAGQEEIQTIDQSTAPMSVSVVVSAFYLPELTDLVDQLPKLDTPLPAEKENPLQTFSTGDQDEETP
ncbi:hypothetical protein [Mangrovibacillus cuniculi]|uniref:Pilus assembly protein PilO n=1 Tax=Mangrovibacillus cuniculi TaxID=2593652 RepID=A0A7S8CBS1_9BACI|nr:hypothetical protein [Mangrovibacillus cuniculi]QPC47055.1 hypothetical protein G8O30_08790 [Mangrovibacillus cuniculi]